jgi:hypothetical protein
MTWSGHRRVHNMSTWRNRITQLPARLSVRVHSASGLVGFPRPPCILAKNPDNLTCTLLPLFDMNRIDGQRSGNGVGLFRSGALGAARIRCPSNPIFGISPPRIPHFNDPLFGSFQQKLKFLGRCGLVATDVQLQPFCRQHSSAFGRVRHESAAPPTPVKPVTLRARLIDQLDGVSVPSRRGRQR